MYHSQKIVIHFDREHLNVWTFKQETKKKQDQEKAKERENKQARKIHKAGEE